MPLIITATDFTDIATNAVNYACGLAGAYNAQVTILHSFMLPVMFSDVPMPASLLNDAQKDADDQMNKLLNDLAIRFPGTLITGKVVYGSTIDALEEFKEAHNDVWLVAIGNSSLAENNTWPDSVLLDSLKILKYPVLAVPPGAVFRSVSRLCFAMDSKHGYENAVLQLNDTITQLHAELHLLHIQTTAGNKDDAAFDEHLKATLAGVNPIYHSINEAGNIDERIRSFAETNNMDWLVIMPRKHSFFEAMLHKSHTKTLAHHIHIPILAIHESGGAK